MKRIIDKQTNLFIRDDFEYNEETEIALEVAPSQGLYLPKWNGETWVEGMAQEEIDLLINVIEEQSEVQMLRDYVLDLDMRVIMMEFGL